MAVALAAHADDFRHLTLEQALHVLEERGLEILYSSDLVQPSMQVRHEPRARRPRAILEEIVRPHGLAVRDAPNGLLILVRAARSPAPAPGNTADGAALAHDSVLPDLEEVIVSASQYMFVRPPTVTVTAMSAADLQLSPDLGDDPMRAAARLPGTASSEFTAKTNIRGGDADETLVRFDGVNLHNPFHLKDFHSAFSTIGPGIVSEMRVYAGGFPVTFGDSLSGVIDIDPLSPAEPAYRELAMSFFNTSALAAGQFSGEGGEWLVSARRGNLDLIVEALNSDIGRPTYADFYGRAAAPISDRFTVSANALVSNDEIVLFDGDKEEEARAAYRDAYYWLRLDYEPSASVSGNVLLSRSKLDSERRGRADQEGIARGALVDEREFTVDSLQSDWSWRVHDNLLMQIGGEWRGMRGRYDYRDEVEFDLLFDVPGAAAALERTRNIRLRPDGDHYALYANFRVGTPQRLAADAGIRWDRDTLSPDDRDQLSPRVSLVYALGERTHVRAAWGRFFQTQAISELQVADGVTQYFRPQRADHLIGSIEYQLGTDIDLRLEVYRKDYRHVRPRYENLLNSFVVLPELKPDRVRIAPDRARATGVELSLRRNGGGPLSWWLSYSRASVEDVLGGTSTPRSWDQRDLFNGGIAWRSDRWELSLAGTYRSGWPTSELVLTGTDPIPIVTTRAVNDRRLHDYRSVDARVARLFRMENAGVLTIFLEANNLMSRTNQCCVEYEAEEEDGEILLDVARLPYLPLTPSLGFVWRF